MTEIKIVNAKKIYNNLPVIENLNLDIPSGSLFTLLGPSGCGKTTLLRMIAGFNSIEGGDFYFNDLRINSIEPSKRNIGMVFQNYAIFPHLTVKENVSFGLKQKKVDKDTLEKETKKFLNLMQIDTYENRKPEKLSGGQQQRVALARALAVNPKVLLMDEPLSNLDAKLRLDMRSAIREIQHEVGITTVYVTHDQEEAMAISDYIAVMKDGKIQQIGKPKELYHRPYNVFVASFIGRTNILSASLKTLEDSTYLVFGDNYKLNLLKKLNIDDQSVLVSIRPEEFVRDNNGDIECLIKDSVYLGKTTEYIVKTNFGSDVQVSEESEFHEEYSANDIIRLKINLSKINIFSKDGERNLLLGEPNEDQEI